MAPIYDNIGINYSGKRRTDPRIAEQIHSQLKGAGRIVNIGAGTGSYEPEHIDLIAVEPSSEMISQRPAGAHRAVQASAEKLPFDTNSFTHAMTVLSMHHWTDRKAAFSEINRVASQGFVAVTWNPEAEPFWLTRDYFPEIHETDLHIFPKLDEFFLFFDEVEIMPLMIPEDCMDGFLGAYWKRPEAYLMPEVRRSISSFAKLENVSVGLEKLRNDLESGRWAERNKDLLKRRSLDIGYVVVSARVKDE